MQGIDPAVSNGHTLEVNLWVLPFTVLTNDVRGKVAVVMTSIGLAVVTSRPGVRKETLSAFVAVTWTCCSSQYVPSDEERKISVFGVSLQEGLQELVQVDRDLFLVRGIVPRAIRVAKSCTYRLVNLKVEEKKWVRIQIRW